jgi:hypothetical protein
VPCVRLPRGAHGGPRCTALPRRLQSH